MQNLYWFRTDLRIKDNTALKQAFLASEKLMAVYIIPAKTWKRHDKALVQQNFILRQLKSLSADLASYNIPLIVKETDYFSDSPKLLLALCQQYKLQTLYMNKEYEVDELKRDKKVTLTLKSHHIEVLAFEDQLILPPNTVLSKQKTPLKVFTPFKKNWLQIAEVQEAWKSSVPSLKKLKPWQEVIPEIQVSLPKISTEIENLWPEGEKKALQHLKHFLEKNVLHYHETRDFPALNTTSRLSPYLAQGILSPRQCAEALLQHFNLKTLSELSALPGPQTWLSELIWREFYKHIAYHFPEVCRHQPFKKETLKLKWNSDLSLLNAWCKGQTGFPLIDAAMRQLAQTGWMHNRLRMVVANFLTKALFIDWRLGEKHFSLHLIDGDLAANNGGWQWSASTGTDAAPYFRIFNPILQSERFDPEGAFIRLYCPELAEMDNQSIHDPYGRNPMLAQSLGYPRPMIDFSKHREQVLSAFKNLS